MRPQFRRYASVLAICTLMLMILLPGDGRLARADSAPMWQSPIGLTPGLLDSRVQLVDESVDVRVIEQDGPIRARVNAEFNLLNHGPDVGMKVGFPTYAMSVLTREPEITYSPVASMPDLESFSARANDMTYQVSRAQVVIRPDDPYGDEWYVWDMTFRGGQSTRLTISYDQPLTWDDEGEQSWVQPMYVLKTGAFWDGPIHAATVTMTAPDGGAFLGGPEAYLDPDHMLPPSGDVLGPDRADEAGINRLVWMFHDFEPAHDVGATYITAATWRALRIGEQLGGTGKADSAAYLAATQAALRVLSTSGPDALPYGPRLAPYSAVARFAPQVRRWAERSVQLAPDDPAAWLAFGDVEVWFARPPRHHMNELACWPTAAVDAYRRALQLGSTFADARLKALDEIPSWMHEMEEPAPRPCPVRAGV